MVTREDVAREMGVLPREVSQVEETEHGTRVVMSSGAHRIVRDDGFYALDEHPDNKRLRRFELPEPEASPEPPAGPDPVDPEDPPVQAPADPTPDADPGIGDVPGGSIEDVMAWVDGDPARALAALEHERAKPSPRKSLIDRLEKL
jgi:hypothetical protein